MPSVSTIHDAYLNFVKCTENGFKREFSPYEIKKDFKN